MLRYGPGWKPGDWDVFRRDRLAGATEIMSVASDGTQAAGHSGIPDISADGRWVAFETSACNLVPDDTTSTFSDLFVHDAQTGLTQRVSVSSGGTQGNNESEFPSLSDDGRFVAFNSAAFNLVVGDTNGRVDVFLHDRLGVPPSPTLTDTPTPTSTPTPSPTPTPPTPTATPTVTPTPTPAGHDSRLTRINGIAKNIHLSPGGSVSDTASITAANQSGHTDTIGVYVDVLAPTAGGCTPSGRVLETTVTLAAGAKTTISVPVSYSCSDPAAANGLSYIWVAVADHGADDLASCGPGSLQGLTCFNALVSDDEDSADNRATRNGPRVVAQ